MIADPFSVARVNSTRCLLPHYLTLVFVDVRPPLGEVNSSPPAGQRDAIL
jgi:hypothetical protein